MSKTKKDNLVMNFQITNIEITDIFLTFPKSEGSNPISYNLEIKNRIEAESKTIVVLIIAHTFVNESEKVGSISVSNTFVIENFDEIIKKNKQEEYEIPESINVVLTSISISTTRGVMYSNFRGTFLHNAILPIVDPKQIKMEKKQKMV